MNIETIRYYQRIGLIDEPRKPKRGFRKYAPESVQKIRFIKRAQQLGFSLQEVTELLAFGNGRCSDVRAHADKKRELIALQIADLQVLHANLGRLISACDSGDDNKLCPIVETLLQRDVR